MAVSSLFRHRSRYGSTTTHSRLVAVAAASIACGSAASGKRFGRMALMSGPAVEPVWHYSSQAVTLAP
jgi:hypothetical protein